MCSATATAKDEHSNGGAFGSHPEGSSRLVEVLHPAGSVLCLTSTVQDSKHGGVPAGTAAPAGVGPIGPMGSTCRKLMWESLRVPEGGGIVVSVVGRASVRAQLGDTRKSAVRRHAKQLASAAYFAPLGTPQLLALCHRAVEVDAEPNGRIPLYETSSTPLLRQPSGAAGAVPDRATVVMKANGEASTHQPRGQQLRPIFMIVLRGTAVLWYTPQAAEAAQAEGESSSNPAASASGATVDGLAANGCSVNGAPANGAPTARVPIYRLRTNDHVGGINVLLGRVDLDGHVRDLELRAGEEGCTLLTWTCDEYLQRELSKLPDLLGSVTTHGLKPWASRASAFVLAHSSYRVRAIAFELSRSSYRVRAIAFVLSRSCYRVRASCACYLRCCCANCPDSFTARIPV